MCSSQVKMVNKETKAVYLLGRKERLVVEEE